MKYTRVQKYIASAVLASFLSAPLSVSAMFLDEGKKHLICQQRALQAQERQIESLQFLVDRSTGSFARQMNQFSQDFDFISSFPGQLMKLTADVGINYTNIASSNITLDLAGLKALIAIVKNAISAIDKIIKFIDRTQRIITRWKNMDKTLKREFAQIMSYINSVKNMSYTKTLERCEKW